MTFKRCDICTADMLGVQRAVNVKVKKGVSKPHKTAEPASTSVSWAFVFVLPGPLATETVYRNVYSQ